MSTIDLSIAKIPVLSSQAQYVDWALEVTATAMIGGFYAPLTGENTTSSTEASELDKLKQREQKAKGLILRAVSPVLKKELIALSPKTSKSPPAGAKEMWDHLKSRFEKKAGMPLLLDFKCFLRSDLVDDGTMEVQLNELTEIRSTCALNDFEVQDWQFASIILIALPERYRNITDSLLSTNDVTKLSVDEVKAKILDQEARHHGNPSSSNHLLLSGNPRAGPSTRKERPTDVCKHCNELGHCAKNCRKKKRD